MNLLNSKILTILLSTFSIWILFSVISVVVEKGGVKKEEAVIESKIDDIKQDNELLERYVKNFENPDFIEKEARLRLNYKKQGEKVIFVYQDLTSDAASSSDKFLLKNLSDYKKLWHWLGKFF